MKRIILIVVVIVAILLSFKYCVFKDKDGSLEYNTNLIQQQIVSVGKLIVTEGHFSEVLTYKDKDSKWLTMLTFEKKALVVVNADVTVAFDLRKMEYKIDEETKTITILNIPEAEIKISPDIKFYDVQTSRLNPFTGDDYNKINKAVKENLAKKVEMSTLKSNAKNRLVSELSKILILTKTMGWTLVYEGNTIVDETQLGENIKL